MRYIKSHARPLAAVLACMLLCGCLLLGGCAAGADASSQSIITARPPDPSSRIEARAADTLLAAPPSAGAQPAEEADAAPVREDEVVSLTLVGTVGSAYAPAPGGCYTVQVYTDGSADLHYLDYTAMTMTQMAEPAKQNENLFGQIAGTYGGLSPLWANDHLYLFHLAGSAEQEETYGEAGRACIMRLNPDGTGFASATLPALHTIALQSGVLQGEGGLYFLAKDGTRAEQAAGAGQSAPWLLMRLDEASMELETLHRLPAGFDYKIDGSWEMGLLLTASTTLPDAKDPGFNAAWEAQEFTLLAMGLYSGTTQQLAQWPQSLPAAITPGFYHWWDEGEGTLYQQNLATGEVTALAGGFAPANPEFTDLRAGYSGTVRLQFTHSRGKVNEVYAINPATGEVTKPPVDKLGQSVTVCAENEDSFLVRYDTKWVRREKLDPFFTAADRTGHYSNDYVEMPEYALISKTNYWAGNKTLQNISDLVYKTGG